MSGSDDEPGVSCFDISAIASYCDSAVKKRYLEARTNLKVFDSRGKLFVVGAHIQPHESALSESKTACKAVYSNIVSKLRDDELILAGFLKGDIRESRLNIPGHVLSAQDRKINRHRKTVQGNGLTFAKVRLYKPSDFLEDSTEEGIPTPTPDKLAPPKGRPGRKPKWDWVSANREMMRLADDDNLPYPQAEIERLFRQWFTDNFGDRPVESAIRDFIVERLPLNYHEKNKPLNSD